jgi:transposase
MSVEEQAVVRKIIIRMKQNGSAIAEIMNAIGCSAQHIANTWRKYNNASGKAAKEKIACADNRGREKGEGRTLTSIQEKRIQKLIANKYPEQLNFDFALWTREAVVRLIRHEFGILMPIRTVGEYLNRWGWTPQKPVKYAYERKPEEVKKWLEIEYPHIKRCAKRAKGEIYWGDETSVSTGDVRGRGYAPVGKTPVVRRAGKREHINMISAITNKGKVFWKIHDKSINGELFLEFVKRLVKKSAHKVYLIVDNLRTHRSKMLKAYLKENKDKIELYYLPAYSPDLNPDEYLNSDMKYGAGSKSPKKTKRELSKAAETHMRLLNRTPERIVKYFNAPAIQYAAM